MPSAWHLLATNWICVFHSPPKDFSFSPLRASGGGGEKDPDVHGVQRGQPPHSDVAQGWDAPPTQRPLPSRGRGDLGHQPGRFQLCSQHQKSHAEARGYLHLPSCQRCRLVRHFVCPGCEWYSRYLSFSQSFIIASSSTVLFVPFYSSVSSRPARSGAHSKEVVELGESGGGPPLVAGRNGHGSDGVSFWLLQCRPASTPLPSKKAFLLA